MFPVRWTHCIALISLTLALLSTAGTLRAQITPIPVKAGRDMVFDSTGQRLYIITTDGFVQRYNVSTGQLETPFNVGGLPNGIDISPDNSFLLIAQGAVGVLQGTVQKVDSSSGAITNINFAREFGEGGAWDVAIGSNGIAFVTTNNQGSGGSTPVLQINLTTNTISVRTDVTAVSNFTSIYRSADATRLYFVEGGGTVFTYSSTTNIFGPTADTQSPNRPAAVNRNGTLLATILYGFEETLSLDTAPNFNYVHNLGAAVGGVAFAAQTDTLYAINTSTNQIIAYDTNTFAEKLRLNIDEKLSFGFGALVASPDGVHLALQTDSSILLYDVTMGTPSLPPTFGTPRDMVFDHAGQRLYVTTAEGFVWPYHLSTNTFGTPFNLGGLLYGLDITADDSVLLVGQRTTGLTQGAFQKINLTTGVITNIVYPRPFSGDGSLDVAVASNGLALGTSGLIYQINPVTNAITQRSDSPGFGFSTLLHRSADRTLLYFLEGNRIYLYNALGNTFGQGLDTHSVVESSAVNRNGTLLGDRLSGNECISGYCSRLQFRPQLQYSR